MQRSIIGCGSYSPATVVTGGRSPGTLLCTLDHEVIWLSNAGGQQLVVIKSNNGRGGGV